MIIPPPTKVFFYLMFSRSGLQKGVSLFSTYIFHPTMVFNKHLSFLNVGLSSDGYLPKQKSSKTLQTMVFPTLMFWNLSLFKNDLQKCWSSNLVVLSNDSLQRVFFMTLQIRIGNDSETP